MASTSLRKTSVTNYSKVIPIKIRAIPLKSNQIRNPCETDLENCPKTKRYENHENQTRFALGLSHIKVSE